MRYKFWIDSKSSEHKEFIQNMVSYFEQNCIVLIGDYLTFFKDNNKRIYVYGMEEKDIDVKSSITRAIQEVGGSQNVEAMIIELQGCHNVNQSIIDYTLADVKKDVSNIKCTFISTANENMDDKAGIRILVKTKLEMKTVEINCTDYDLPCMTMVIGIGTAGIRAINYMSDGNPYSDIVFVAISTEKDDLATSDDIKVIQLTSDEVSKKNELIVHEICSILGLDIEGLYAVLFTISTSGNAFDMNFTRNLLLQARKSENTRSFAQRKRKVYAPIYNGLLCISIAINSSSSFKTGRESEEKEILKLIRCADSVIAIDDIPLKTKIDDGSYDCIHQQCFLAWIIISSLFHMYSYSVPTYVGMDLGEIHDFFQKSGKMVAGIGEASGENAYVHAAKIAIDQIAQQVELNQLRRLLVHFTCSEQNASLQYLNDALNEIIKSLDDASKVTESHPDVEGSGVLFNLSTDETLNNKVCSVVLAGR